MRISTACDYALHSLLYIAVHTRSDHASILIDDMATAQNIPKSYLAKIFQMLAKSNLVKSKRGAKGGFSLARPAQEITMAEVVRAIEGTQPIYNCESLQDSCEMFPRCTILSVFREAEEKMYQVLSRTTLKDLVVEVSRFPDKIGWLRKKDKAVVVE
ncbi:MAG: RrF2 family transcriptional regulator [bacterium]